MCLECGPRQGIPRYALLVQGGEEVDAVAKLAQQGPIVLGKVVATVGGGARDGDVFSFKSLFLSLSLWLTPLGGLAWCCFLLLCWTLVIEVNDGLWMDRDPYLPLELLVHLFSLILSPCQDDVTWSQALPISYDHGVQARDTSARPSCSPSTPH